MTVAIKPGQIWRALFRRPFPCVRIIEVVPPDGLSCLVKMRSVRQERGGWVFVKNSRWTWRDSAAFNGKPGGYELYEDVS